MPDPTPKHLSDASIPEVTTLGTNDRIPISPENSPTQLKFFKPGVITTFLNNIFQGKNARLDSLVNQTTPGSSKTLNLNASGSIELVDKADLVSGQIPASQARASTLVYTSATGVLTFTDAKGTVTNIDLPVENLFENAAYNSGSKTLTLTTNGGGTINVPLSDLVDLPEIVIATVDPGVNPTSGQKLYLRSDTGEYWVANGSIWQGKYLSFTSAERVKLSGIATGATANSTDAALLNRANHTGTQLASTISDFTTVARASFSAGSNITITDGVIASTASGSGTTNLSIANRTTTSLDIASSSGTSATVPVVTTSFAGLLSSTDKTKLDGIATAATANSTDAALLSRANHTGTQNWTTIIGTPTTVSGYGITDAATLSGGKLTASQVPTEIASQRPKVELNSSRTLTVNDVNKHLFYQGTTAITVTIPSSLIAASSEIEISQLGTGVVTIAVDGGAITINGASTSLTLSQYAAYILNFYTTNNVIAYGGGLGARLTSIATQANPASAKLVQLNSNGTISFVDPSGGSSGSITGNLTVTGNGTFGSYIQAGSIASGSLPTASGVAGAIARNSTSTYLTYSDGTSWNEIAPSFSHSTVTGGSATVNLSVKGKFLACNSSSPQTVILPSDSTAAYAIGEWVEICQIGTGAVTINADTSTTVVRHNSSATTGHVLGGLYVSCLARKIAANTWLLIGGAF